MGCITEILKIKGDRDFMVVRDKESNPWIALEGGGKYKDYEYLIVLNHNGHRCGYVAIPPEHKYANTHLKKYDLNGREYEDYDYDSLDIECHGSLTFMDNNHGLKNLLSTPCKDLWIGFDCGHFNDTNDFDAMEKYFGKEYKENKLKYWPLDDGGVVREYSYVEKECHSIIDQLVEIK